MNLKGINIVRRHVTIFKKVDQISTTPIVREIISSTEEGIKLVYAKKEEYVGQIELKIKKNFLFLIYKYQLMLL